MNVADECRFIEPQQGAIVRYRPLELVVRQVQGHEVLELSELRWHRTRDLIAGKVQDLEIDQAANLSGYTSREIVMREVSANFKPTRTMNQTQQKKGRNWDVISILGSNRFDAM